jgi:four helix bundle protein
MTLELSKELKSYKEFDLASQRLTSGTLIGANVNEAGAAVSKKDFVNKMSIALKEARESWHWLRLLKESKTIEINVEQNIDRCIKLIKIRTSIIKTTQSKIRK